MKRKMSAIIVLLLTTSLLITSCNGSVPQEEYDAITAARDTLMAERDTKAAELSEAQEEKGNLQRERDAAMADLSNLQSKQDTSLAELAELQRERDAALAQIEDLQGKRDTALAEITALQAERDTALTEIVNLQGERDAALAEIEDLQELAGVPTISILTEEAWDTAVERYTTLRESIDFNLEEVAPWVKLPERPVWLDSARVCSAVLADEPGAFETVCLITLPDQQLFMSLYEYKGITTALCRGSSQEYLMTVARDEAGTISEVTMLASESSSILTWTEVGGDKFFRASVDGEIYEVPWSDDPPNLESFCGGFVNWLGTIDKTGGLIAAQDQPLMFLGLGGLHKSLHAPFLANWRVIASRVAMDILHGVPASGWW